jgi:hypothetical protein
LARSWIEAQEIIATRYAAIEILRPGALAGLISDRD